MKNKAFIQVITILLLLAGIYQLSFTLVTRSVEKKAKATAELKFPENFQGEIDQIAGAESAFDKEYPDSVKSKMSPDALENLKTTFLKDYIAENRELYRKHYLDSMRPIKVYDLFIGGFTYQECVEKELNLGLDLQGGMNVTLEVSTPAIIRNMAGKTNNAAFLKAMDEAEKVYLGQRNFVDVLAEKYAEIDPNGKLAPIFYTKEIDEYLPNKFNSSNEEVYAYLKSELSAAIDRAFEIITTRIDKFGVAQPNIQQLDNGRILVELPGVDDPSRVRKILQGAAELEFWFVYKPNDAYNVLTEVNKLIASMNVLAGDSADNLTSELTGEESLGSLLTGEDSTEINALTGDSAKNDSLGLGDADKSDEELAAENPLFSKFSPNIDRENNVWNPGMLGYVSKTDMEQFNKWFEMPEVKALIPQDLHFRWSFKALDEAGQVMGLYALRSNVRGEPALSGDVITDARPTRQPNGALDVSMSMNQEGARIWKIITAQASSATPKEAIAIVLDGQVYSAPTVQNEIANGQSVIQGNYTQAEAEDLSNILKAGKLPAPTRIAGESTVGPTLGASAIKSGTTSLLIGFVLVILFMILYYGKAGIYADIALMVNLILIVGVLAGWGAALTLPGMAGLVLTIGMAVDANVLVFERIREEMANDKSFKMAVKDGYRGAYSSIIDANLTTAIAGFILLVLGKGPVMGFAVILVIGIASSLFTSIFLTRLFIERDMEKGRETSFYTKLTGKFFQNFNWDFIGKRKIFYIVSGLVIAAGIVSMATKGLQTGIDFKGGWSYTVKVDNANVAAIRSALNESLKEGNKKMNNEVKTYGANNQYRITTSYLIDNMDPNIADSVENTIVAALSDFGVEQEDILSSDKVGPTIAKDIKVRSTWAIVFALIGMFLYIIGRFRKWGFGLGATVALLHDVLIVFSIYSIFGNILPFSLDIDQAFIAAILTVVGYSINDTVVVFDRVREFLVKNKHESNLSKTINDSINQTLSRTMITSLTTLLVIVILFIAGGEGLKDFTFALLVGVGVGTYSSICIATPIVVDFIKKGKK